MEIFMNFIFDIGNVLVDFKPDEFLHELLNNPQDEKKINETIYKSRQWIELDLGTITSEEACAIFCEREPEYKAVIEKVMGKLPEMFTPKQRTIDILPEIKKLGHKLYYLSNFHKELSRNILDRYAFFDLFDGGVFSCDVHMVKPNPEIYRRILDNYGLAPRDCVFFDDTKVNVDAAAEIGITGVLFADARNLEDFIKTITM